MTNTIIEDKFKLYKLFDTKFLTVKYNFIERKFFMKKLKFLLLTLVVVVLCGCGKAKSTNIIEKFENKVNSTKSYQISGLMEIVSNEETFSYDVGVDYKYDEFYKVTLLNKTNNHEQVILKDGESVYVVTPALNKSFKFQSEWPDNSSQSYLLKSLLKDIKSTSNPVVDENEEYYIINANVNYPNNSKLKTEKIYFDKNGNLKEVQVLNKDGNAIIRMKFNSIKYSVKFEDNNFSLDSLITKCDDDSSCKKEDSKPSESAETSAVKDIIYPLFLPEDTHLSTKDTVKTEGSDRVIMTYAGAKPFMIIEEPVTTSNEMEITSVTGSPALLSSAVAAIGDNSLEWQSNNMSYYITSSYLTGEEMMTIAESLNTASVVEITNDK